MPKLAPVGSSKRGVKNGTGKYANGFTGASIALLDSAYRTGRRVQNRSASTVLNSHFKITCSETKVPNRFYMAGGCLHKEFLMERNVESASGFEYELNEMRNGIVITGYCGSGGAVVIPATIDGMPVEACRASFKNKGITAITFADSITRIVNPAPLQADPSMFDDKLEKAVLPKQLKSIPMRMFEGCSRLVDLQLPEELEILGEGACCKTAINALTLPKSLKQLGRGGFYGCANLLSVSIPFVLRLGMDAFQNCTKLESVTIEAAKRIESNAFRGCNQLKSITIAADIEAIADVAFCDCTSLTNVSLPKKQIQYGTMVFSGCKSLSEDSRQAIKASGYAGSF